MGSGAATGSEHNCWRKGQRAFLIATGLFLFSFLVIFVIQIRRAQLETNRLYEEFAAQAILEIQSVGVCLVGVSRNLAAVLHAHDQWGGALPAVFSIYDSSPGSDLRAVRNNLYVLSNTSSVEETYAATKVLFPSCQYYFLLDAELPILLDYKLAGVPSTNCERSPNMCYIHVLSKALNQYKPAVAGFPWPAGIKKVLAMRKMALAYRHSDVAPLTGFVPNFAIYHHSTADFFMPYIEHDNSTFVQMLAPLIFQESAIRLNSFRPFNGTTEAEDHGSALVLDLFHPPEAGEALEAMRRVWYLSSGIRHIGARWGWHLLPRDVSAPKAGQGRSSYGGLWFAKRLNDVYEIRHEPIRTHPFLQTMLASNSDLRMQLVRSVNYTFAIHLLTSTQQSSFRRLWHSIEAATRINRTVRIFIHVDVDPTYAADERATYIEYLSALQSVHGQVRVAVAPSPRGPKNAMLWAWRTRSRDEYGIFLWDSIEVSPAFLVFADAIVSAYFYDGVPSARAATTNAAYSSLLGISLYSPRYSQVLNEDIAIAGRAGSRLLYVSPVPHDMGIVFAAAQWRRFVDYASSFRGDPIVPHSYLNRVPAGSSWIKYMLRYNIVRNKFIVFPNLPGGQSLTTVHVDAQELVSDPSLAQKFSVPLYSPSEGLNSSQMAVPALETVTAFNAYYKVARSVNDINAGIDTTTFDRCTMILTVYDRTATIQDRLAYYTNFTYLKQIVLVWNNINIAPPELPQYAIPVHVLRMTRNSLNNRFFPYSIIDTDCIINMDDDWDMPFAHLSYAVDLWRSSFWNHIIGYAHLGRNHVRNPMSKSPEWVYGVWSNEPRNGKRPFYSIALPSGLVYHRKYLHMYTYGIPQAARDLVDSTMNCDDLLFNFMVANATAAGPVIVHVWSRAINMPGLWRRPSHFAVRSRCLDQLSSIFGGRMPLMYSTNSFKIGEPLPAPTQHTSQPTIPYDLPCDVKHFRRSVICRFITE